MKLIFTVLLLFTSSLVHAQVNCEAFKYMGDTLKYKACNKAMDASAYHQFAREYQVINDEAIAIDPTFDYPYRQKSYAYLKSGDFITWRKLIDKAVALNPMEHLGYRGWCRYQFFRDYEGAISDFEKLEEIVGPDLGYSANGDYHLQIARAVCYKAMGQRDKAIELIINYMADENYSTGIYDYLHLGILYYEKGEYDLAILNLKKQELINDLAENRYYTGLSHKALGELEKYSTEIEKAHQLYTRGVRMQDPYTHPYDKIYLQMIEKEL